ncbi:flagellar protein FlaG [Marinobacter sp.]|uniref:flagellar protein FlaG n=1 Tax=Marinobacter sp. TaxID=50741 RepID=UPI003A8FAF20
MDVGKTNGTVVALASTAAIPSPPRETGISSFSDKIESEKTNDPSGQVADRKDLDNALTSLQSQMKMLNRDLNFSVDDSTGDVVVKVIDVESGNVIRQLPSEEALRLSESLEDLRSLMLHTKA